MVDIHCHLLPGIDDGATSFEDSAAMCEQLVADGCRAVIATPHQRHDLWPNHDLAALEHLRRNVAEHAPASLEIHLGAEIRVDSEIPDELVRGGGLQPLAGGHHLLIEFDRREPPPGTGAVDLVHELVVLGWRPIVAHPELIAWLAEDLDTTTELVERGARLQVTAMSVTGDFGRFAQARCQRLLDAGLVHFVASDAHSPRQRPPGLSRARRLVAERHGEDVAVLLTATNPGAVLLDQDVPAVPS
jgi:protein-tyrosine phosphatase